MPCDQTMKLLFVLFGFPGPAICEESPGILDVYSRNRLHFLAAILGSLLLVSSGFAGELGALCSAAKNFVSAAKTQEGILITYPAASEFAASTTAYAAAKERYFLEFRAAMPILIVIGLKQRPETAEIEEFRSAFKLLDAEEKQRVAKATVEKLKGFGNDQAVAAAEKEFTHAQNIEADFFKDFDGLDSA